MADDATGNGKEAEANTVAADNLIPSDAWRTFIATRDYRSKAVIQAFAAESGIAPGIIFLVAASSHVPTANMQISPPALFAKPKTHGEMLVTIGSPTRIRTWNLLINSQPLYR